MNISSLMDIAVVDNISFFKNLGRFVLNYVFWNYVLELRVYLK
jgi:hypothetical protein